MDVFKEITILSELNTLPETPLISTALAGTLGKVLVVVCYQQQCLPAAHQLANQLSVELVEDVPLKKLSNDMIAVVFDEGGVYAKYTGKRTEGAVQAEFVHGKLGFRRNRQEAKPLIAKAVGLKSGIKPGVWDMTAGLGQDGFVLAMLGCRVAMFERNPVVHMLLADGIARARAAATDDAGLGDVINRMALQPVDSRDVLRQVPAESFSGEANQLFNPDVIYLDPMFPERQKSAKVKKAMQLFHSLVGADQDADDLFELALACAEYRVVVKRPKLAPVLGGKEPSLSFSGKSVRFDVYTKKTLEGLRL